MERSGVPTSYFSTIVRGDPRQAHRVLSQLAGAQVELTAFQAIPAGDGQTQLVLIPQVPRELRRAARRLGIQLQGPYRGPLPAESPLTPPQPQPAGSAETGGDPGEVDPALPATTRPEGRFRIIRRLGVGGMAEVFLAESESIAGFRKRVAIKRILPRLTTNTHLRNMFLDEARLSLWLQHSRIVQVFDIGRADDTYFIVMEYVDGVDVRTLLTSSLRQGGPMPVRLTLHIGLEACSALDYAHSMRHPETGAPLGIVHRDVTPTNILLSCEGEVKVLDFGVARAANQVAVTDPGHIKGKLAYLAPEMASGQAFDRRVDLFGLGVVLWELLAGRRLYRAQSDLETIRMAQRAVIPDLSEINTEVDSELMCVLRTALAVLPEDRFQTAAEMAEAIANYSYSHDQKVTTQDLARHVRRCQLERENWSQPGTFRSEVEDTLVEEVEQYESILVELSNRSLHLPPRPSPHRAGPAQAVPGPPEPAATPAPEPAATPAPEPAATPAPEPAATPAPEPAGPPAEQELSRPEPAPSPSPTTTALTSPPDRPAAEFGSETRLAAVAAGIRPPRWVSAGALGPGIGEETRVAMRSALVSHREHRGRLIIGLFLLAVVLLVALILAHSL